MKTNNHHRSLLALLQIPDFGVRRIKILLDRTGVDDASDLFDMKLPDLLRIDGFGGQMAKSFVQFDDWDKVDSILEETGKKGADLISIDDEYYPPLLKHTYDPPILLWVKGNKEALLADGLAMVGTRRPGKYGLKQAEMWAQKLTAAGLCVNSGLAYGIDAASHRATLESGGKTVAVLGSGIDVIYPSRNSKLANDIIEQGGAIITEQPPGAAPDAVNFPGRNRIVSGMSHGVLVVESAIKGGSMITARYGLDQNREVFVIPHPLDYPGGEGCNYLIRTGQGKLVQSIEDILDEISVQSGSDSQQVQNIKKKWENLELDEMSREICELLTDDELHIDQISEQIEKPTYTLLPALLDLEMKGAIKQKAGKYFELC
ncbi:DNA-processing protein DprA [Rhodohalobacter sp. 614A]|uniref:DNA-processing protein DprA n=1 Tax=Rhodohalobacter sp. 614A TaxID=2908649 RepID=UPI001F234465|nr:DNA-processing protein DprA [Rhodohalobacter sp. 614A]